MKILIGFILAVLSQQAYSACTTTVALGGNVATAINSAAAGSTVCLNTGDHGTVTLNGTSKASRVFIEPTTPGSDTRIVLFMTAVNNLTFQGFKMGRVDMWNCSSNISILNNTWIEQADGIYINQLSGCGATDKNILIEGNTMINVSRTNNEGKIEFYAVNGLTIRNNLIQGNIATTAVGDGIQMGDTNNNLLIEGNHFKDLLQAPCEATPGVPHCDAIQFVGGGSNIIVRDNFFDNVEVVLQDHDGTTGALFTNNVIKNAVQFWMYSAPGNVNGAVISHNVFYNLGLMQAGRNGSGVSDTTTLGLNNNIFISTSPNLCSGASCLATNNLFSSGAFGTNSLTGSPTFVGGSPASIPTYAGFALATGSLGKGTASDGLDRGINVSGGGDVTPPTVSSNVPAINSTNIAANSNITITFSEPIDPATIDATTFKLSKFSDGSAVATTITYNAGTNTVTMDPTASLTVPSTVYTVTVEGGSAPTVKDVAGNAMQSNYTFNFTTTNTGDVTNPTILFKSPLPGLTNVPLNVKPSIFFSEAMDPATISGSTITLINTSTTAAVTATVTYNSTLNKAVLTPSSNLASSTNYTATVKGTASGVKDVAGNALVADTVWSFTTGTVTDTTGPVIELKNPIANETGVSPIFAPQFKFNEPMQTGSITSANIELRKKSDSSLVTSTVTFSGGASSDYGMATIVPGSLLVNNTTYTVSVNTNVMDISGNSMGTAQSWDFTTGTFTSNTLTINAQNGTAQNPIIINGQTFSSFRGDCLLVFNSSYLKIVGNRFINCYLNGVGMNNSHHIDIIGNYFENTGGMTYAGGTTGAIRILNNKSKNTYKRVTSARGHSITQFNASTNANGQNIVAGNFTYDDDTRSTKEDSVAFHQSSGAAGLENIVENNIIIGGGRSPSGACINLGDAGGDYNIARNNTCWNSSQVGIGIAGGDHNTLTGNTVYGANRKWSNVGAAVSLATTGGCTNITFTNNTIDWTNRNGVVNNQFLDTGTCTFLSTTGNVASTTLSSMTLPTMGEFIVPSGVVARFNFETDCFTCDFYANNERSTNISYMPVAQAGKHGDAAYFDGTKYITGTLNPSDFTSAGYSFSFWVNPDSETLDNTRLSSTETLKSVEAMLFNRYIFEAIQQRNISTNYTSSIVFNNAKGPYANTIQAGQWSHIAITYGSNQQKLYVNGNLVATMKRTKPMTSQFTQLRIGSAVYGKKFKGKIDTFYVFSRALTQSDVTSLNTQAFN